MKRLITSATLIAALVCASAALAHGSIVRVSGIQAPPDRTAGAPGDPCAVVDPETGQPPFVSNAMAGSLVGCWYTDTFKITAKKPNGVVHAVGTEHFIGCLHTGRRGGCTKADRTGTLALTARFQFEFDQAGKEISGRCQHKIVSGTGDFDGAAGRIDFKDNVTNGTSTYRGQITLAKPHRSAHATAAAAGPAASRPTSMC